MRRWSPVLAVIAVSSLTAGLAPRFVAETGKSVLWRGQEPIEYSISEGSFGAYSREEVVQAFEGAIDTWRSIPTAEIPIMVPAMGGVPAVTTASEHAQLLAGGK